MHDHNIHSLATINQPASPRRNSLPIASHQNPENIQRLFRLQKCFSRKSSISRKFSKTFRPTSIIPAATSNHPAINSTNQQQQSTAATSSSNQQQQPATAINSSNQQKQSTATTGSSNQHSSINQHSRSHQQPSNRHLHD